MRFATILPVVFILLAADGCGRRQQNPYHYFTRLQQFRLHVMSAAANYTAHRNAERITPEEAHLKKDLIALLLQTEDSVRRCVFTKEDFGLKKAILNEFSYSRKLLTDTPFLAGSRNTALSFEERLKALETISGILDRNTKQLNQQILKSQLAFARFYRIPITTR
ncbi:MAG: hypothetical protein J7599_17505 [Niabella sp.]|nr:hypothetical protein [Niabella sp.]